MQPKSPFAFLFPGQGSQSEKMLQDFYERFSVVRDTFAMAADTLHFDLWDIVQNDSNRLHQTQYTQPILLTSSVALWRVFELHCEDKPAYVAGHSLGEYSALVVADALSFEDGLTLVSHRGRLMQEAVPTGAGAMAAIVGLTAPVVEEICSSLNKTYVAPANYNSEIQVVISGWKEGVLQAIDLAKLRGAKLAKLLEVSVPSHSALMEEAAHQFEEILNTFSLDSPKYPVINNVDVCIETEPQRIRNALVRQLYKPVRWTETIGALKNHQVVQCYEMGPGSVLTGLNRRIDKQLETIPLSDISLLQ